MYFDECNSRNKFIIHYIIVSTYHILDIIHQAVPHKSFFDPVECASSAHVSRGGVNMARQQDFLLLFFVHNIT